MGDNGYQMEYGLCPSWALSLGYLGVASGAVLSNWGSAVSFFFDAFYFGVGRQGARAMIMLRLSPERLPSEF